MVGVEKLEFETGWGVGKMVGERDPIIELSLCIMTSTKKQFKILGHTHV